MGVTGMRYFIEDSLGNVLNDRPTESFWDACVDARVLARRLRSKVLIVSEDDSEKPFEVDYLPPGAFEWPTDLLKKATARARSSTS